MKDWKDILYERTKHEPINFKGLETMNIQKLTSGQRKALLQSLEAQKSPKTTAEVKTLNELREYFSEEVETEEGFKMIRCGNCVKMPYESFDTFGEDYRNNWIKLRKSGKGEYFLSYYLSSTSSAKRIYLK